MREPQRVLGLPDAPPPSACQRWQTQALVKAGACLVKARRRGPRPGMKRARRAQAALDARWTPLIEAALA